MAYTGLCAGGLNNYIIPVRRLEVERKLSGTDVDEVIKVARIDGVVGRDEAELVIF